MTTSLAPNRWLSDATVAHLADDSFDVGTAAGEALARDGFVRVPGVLDPEAVAELASLVADVAAKSPMRAVPLEQRTVYQKAFLQDVNVWQRRGSIRPVTFSTRLGRIAADLLGADAVRLYHDQSLVKEAHGGRTPWHCDQQYWPLATDATLTVWIPLQDVPAEMGPLAFRAGSHRLTFGRDLDISAESEAALESNTRWRDLVVDAAPFAAGDVSFHHGWTFHGATPNHTDRDRLAMTMIYVPDGTTLSEPSTPGQEWDRVAFVPDTEVGDPVATWLNPIVWSRDGAHRHTIDELPPPALKLGPFELG